MSTTQIRDKKAQQLFDKLSLYMDSKGGYQPPTKVIPIIGFFRKNPYEWVVFKFYRNDDRDWALDTIENVHHEGQVQRRIQELNW